MHGANAGAAFPCGRVAPVSHLQDDAAVDQVRVRIWQREFQVYIPAIMLDRRVRACDPWPGAYTWLEGERLRILRACPRPEWPGKGLPGQIVATGTGIGVVTGQGLLDLLEVQLAGKKALNAELFARGRRGLIGSRLG